MMQIKDWSGKHLLQQAWIANDISMISKVTITQQLLPLSVILLRHARIIQTKHILDYWVKYILHQIKPDSYGYIEVDHKEPNLI